MTRILLLGATGRTGAAILKALTPEATVCAAVRDPADVERLSITPARREHALVDIARIESVRRAMKGVEFVINAIRLREDIAPDRLIALHNRIRQSGEAIHGEIPTIVTVGGAGALRLPGGRRFWQSAAFPQATLPRGLAHAALRDHLEAGNAGEQWSYLVPPPVYDPEGPRTDSWEWWPPSRDESSFTTRAISYADFGAAVVAAVAENRTGTHLVAGAH